MTRPILRKADSSADRHAAVEPGARKTSTLTPISRQLSRIDQHEQFEREQRVGHHIARHAFHRRDGEDEHGDRR